MGIHREVKEWYTCDVCGEDCSNTNHSHSIIKTQYMDSEPSKVNISISFVDPWDKPGTERIVCKDCQSLHFRILANRLDKIGEEFEMQN